MRALRKAFLLTLLIAFSTVMLFGCINIKMPCFFHSDADGNGICDKCEKVLSTPPVDDGSVVLINEWGAPTFQIVIADGVDEVSKRYLTDLVRDLELIGIELKVVSDTETGVQDCEVLVGNVTSRGDKYLFDMHRLGKEGYYIKIIDGKIAINGGSDEALAGAVKLFITDILGFTPEAKDLYNVVMKQEDIMDKPQTVYTLNSLSVNGVPVSDYTIATDASIPHYLESAEYIRDTLYEHLGYWLEIVPLSDAKKSIVLTEIPRVVGDGSFKITATDDNRLLIECAYHNRIYDSVVAFVQDKLLSATGDVNLTGKVISSDVSVVYYEDFGAKGDGKTNDFAAMKLAHDVANECGQTVKSKNPTKAKYYISDAHIGGAVETIIIKTNVDFGGAEIIIDDSLLECKSASGEHYVHIFRVEPTYEATRITDTETLNRIVAAGLNPDTEKIDLGLGYDAMLIPVNKTQTVYRRKGYGGYRGYPMSELVVIDKDGNVDRETALMFTYTSLNYIEVYRIDETPITVQNAKITTIVSQFDTVYTTVTGEKDAYESNYFKRGLEVCRSNTTIKNIEHYVEGEFTLEDQANGKIGVCYYGFFVVNNTNNVTLEDCVLTGRRCFWRGIAWKGGGGTQGTYDMQVSFSNKTVFKGCTQSNFWVNDDGEAVERGAPGAKLSMGMSSRFAGASAFVKMYWGIGGSNDAKNMEYYDCVLSRFDAHRGLYNGKIINSSVTGISLTGGGQMIMENVEWYSCNNGRSENGLVILRDDYGSTWRGEIYIKNIKAYPYPEKVGTRYYNMWLASHQYTNWDFGYTCYFPNIRVDGFSIYDRTTITRDNPVGNKITPDKITVTLTTINYSWGKVYGEPNLHLDTTLKKHPFLNVEGEQNGVEQKNSYENLNPIVPPEYIILSRFDGHSLNLQNSDTTFLDNTYIEVDGVIKNNPQKS